MHVGLFFKRSARRPVSLSFRDFFVMVADIFIFPALSDPFASIQYVPRRMKAEAIIGRPSCAFQIYPVHEFPASVSSRALSLYRPFSTVNDQGMKRDVYDKSVDSAQRKRYRSWATSKESGFLKIFRRQENVFPLFTSPGGSSSSPGDEESP